MPGEAGRLPAAPERRSND